MPSADDSLRSLREALRVSPRNVPLRQHLAETLVGLGRHAEAEAEYRQALAEAPKQQSLLVALAECYFQQGKDSPALVIVEELLRATDTAGGVFLLHARLLERSGDLARAAHQYRAALDQDPALADRELAQRLGLKATSGDMPAPADSAPGEWDDSDDDLPPDGRLERPKISFADVGGMEGVKEEIRLKIIHPLAHAELFKAYGKSVGGGLLMYGPPGCGKTHLARATAGEVQAGFLSVGISDVLDMWIGSSEKNLHELFQQARRHAPCVLFFDEVDALGASRADMRQAAGRHLINQFLAEMDGADNSNDGVLILAATNAPWHLDSAFRRPGRFDRIVFVPPPDATARSEILRVMCQGKPVEGLDYSQVASKTSGLSGADLKAVVDLAIEDKLQQALKDGAVRPLTTRDLLAAAKRVKPSTQEWFSTARNYAMFANQAGTYDDILKYLQGGK